MNCAIENKNNDGQIERSRNLGRPCLDFARQDWILKANNTTEFKSLNYELHK
jgi:hypothetical protein